MLQHVMQILVRFQAIGLGGLCRVLNYAEQNALHELRVYQCSTDPSIT